MYSLTVPQEKDEPRRKQIKTQDVLWADRRGVTPEVKQDIPKIKAATPSTLLLARV